MSTYIELSKQKNNERTESGYRKVVAREISAEPRRVYTFIMYLK